MLTLKRFSVNQRPFRFSATVKHITVDIQTIPTVVYVSSRVADKVVYFPAPVPVGTFPVEPFSATDGTIYNSTLYEPQNYVLGSCTFSQGSTAVVPTKSTDIRHITPMDTVLSYAVKYLVVCWTNVYPEGHT